jgi:hypothetical protein
MGTTFMKVLMQAYDIPLESSVTKKNGEKKYTIRDRVKIFGDTDPERQKELVADDGTRFLVSEKGDINVIAGETELVWHIEMERLHDFLDSKLNPRFA